MEEIAVFNCTVCGHVDAFNANVVVKDRRCPKCLTGYMQQINAKTGPMSGDVTKFFRVSE